MNLIKTMKMLIANLILDAMYDKKHDLINNAVEKMQPTLQPEGNFSASSHFIKSGQLPLCSRATMRHGLRMTLPITSQSIFQH